MTVRCPICGDPSPFVLWVDPRPPVECPYNPAAKSVTDCTFQMQRGFQRAAWRKRFPHCFDENGNIKPGGLAHILENTPGEPVII